MMVMVDVEALDAAPKGVLGLCRGLPISLRRRDHLPAGGRALADRVRELVRPSLGRNPTGPMLLLSQPRAFGLTFDPVSFVYCMDASGRRTEAVLAEVSNTPWGERHVYTLTGGETGGGRHRFDATKRLHVSPFFGMDHEYQFEFSDPGATASLSIENRREGDVVFRAGLALEQVGTAQAPPWSTIARHPWMPAETLVGIYSQALRLALKRARFHTHPRRRMGAGGASATPARPRGPR